MIPDRARHTAGSGHPQPEGDVMSTRTPAVVETNLACALRPHDVLADHQGDVFATVIGVMQSPSMPEVVAIYVTLAVNGEVMVLARDRYAPVDVLVRPGGQDPEPIVVHQMTRRFGDVLTGDIMFRWDGSDPRFYVLEATTRGDDEGIATTKVYNFATGETLDWSVHKDTVVTVAAR